MGCGIVGHRIQHVSWRALNLPVFSNFKNVIILCGTNNLLLDSSKDIADDILEIARSFKTHYSYVNVVIWGILPHDDSRCVNRVPIKEVKKMLWMILHFISYGSGWTLANGPLNADLYYSNRLHLLEKENLKLT